MIHNIIGAFLVSLVASSIAIPIIIKQLHKRSLIDTPDRRKVHRGFIPSLGGIGIYIAICFATLLFITLNGISSLKFLLIGSVVLFIIGIRDDVKPIKPRIKLLFQIVATIIVIAGGILVHSDYGLFGLNDLNITLRLFLTIGFIVFFTNSFNLIDGLDGLAGTIGIIISGFFSVWFYLNSNMYLAVLSASITGSLLGFLYFNWQPAKIFMGDTGSLTLGFIFATMGIEFMNETYLLDNEIQKINAPISMMIAVLFVPLFDTFRIIVVRLVKKRSPFSPDNNHVHHVLLRLGFQHKYVALLLAGINIFFIVLVLSLSKMEDYIILPIVILLSFILSVIFDQLIISRVRSRGGKARQRMKADLNIK